MDQLAALLANPPELAQALSQFRPCGVSERYEVHDRWALNLYDFSGELLVYNKQGKVRSTRIAPACAALLPPCRRAFRITQPGHHWVALFKLPARPAFLPRHPVFIPCAGYFREFEQQFDEAIARQEQEPRHAEALFWSLLWTLRALGPRGGESGRRHPGLQAATVFIRDHLCDCPELTAVAEAAGISHNHLNRLCREHYGCSIGGYLLSRRMELARHLLCDSTVTVKEVAARVGLADLQQFNKTVRRYFGASPTALRTQSRPGH